MTKIVKSAEANIGLFFHHFDPEIPKKTYLVRRL